MCAYRKSPVTIAKMVLGGLVFLAIVPLVTQLLWNALMPEIFNLSTITYWQALGLLVLSKILFSGFSKYGGKPHKSDCHPHPEYIKKFKDKMKGMTDEQKRACFSRGMFGEEKHEIKDNS